MNDLPPSQLPGPGWLDFFILIVAVAKQEVQVVGFFVFLQVFFELPRDPGSLNTGVCVILIKSHLQIIVLTILAYPSFYASHESHKLHCKNAVASI